MESDNTQRLIDGYGAQIVDPQERVLFADAVLGHEAQLWLKSPMGRFIAGRAKEELDDFVVWAMSADATAEEFPQRRARALAARTLLAWTTEQIEAGVAAEYRLAQNEGEGQSER